MEKLTFWQKLAQLQDKLKPIKKDEVNPHFKNRYFDINSVIAEVKPALNELGLVLLQPLTTHDGRPSITTILQDTESDGEITSYFLLPDVTDPQKMGAACTYYRRFAIVSLLCLEAEDDDGNTAARPQNAPGTPNPDYVAKMQEGRSNAIGSKCPKCGVGEMKTSMKGSLYCSDKCWLQTPKVEMDRPEYDDSGIPF